jgi:signal transduction histidine kinase
MTETRRPAHGVLEQAAPADDRPADARGRAGEDELAALRHEIALRDDFISIAAHELRNPISPAYMQLEHLKEVVARSDGPIDRAWLGQQLDTMTTRFDRFLEILNRMLDASRVGAGHLVLSPEPCDLAEITRAVLAAAQRELAASRCTVELHASAAMVGSWDRFRIEQIVGNLVSNAARYGAGRPVEVHLHQDLDTVQLIVRDHGIGIALEDQAQIFERFGRARNVGRHAGFGIGLWVVAELCRAMGGRILVDSELGKGSTFTVALPRAQADRVS